MLRKGILGCTAVVVAVGLAGCSGASKNEQTTLRIAMGSPGEGLIKVWEDIAKEFESQHKDIKV